MWIWTKMKGHQPKLTQWGVMLSAMKLKEIENSSRDGKWVMKLWFQAFKHTDSDIKTFSSSTSVIMLTVLRDYVLLEIQKTRHPKTLPLSVRSYMKLLNSILLLLCHAHHDNSSCPLYAETYTQTTHTSMLMLFSTLVNAERMKETPSKQFSTSHLSFTNT